MNEFSKYKWDTFYFSSYISVYCNVQAIYFDKVKKVIVLENGYCDTKKIEVLLTDEEINEVENCFEEMSICEWADASFNPGADGERWMFEFYKGEHRVLFRYGGNAYPKGYGKWIKLYSGLFKNNGLGEVYSCYRKEKEGVVIMEERK